MRPGANHLILGEEDRKAVHKPVHTACRNLGQLGKSEAKNIGTPYISRAEIYGP